VTQAGPGPIPAPALDLTDNVVVIIGAGGGGIGSAIALAAAGAGAHVVGLDVSADALAAIAGSTGSGRITPLIANALDAKEISGVLRDVEREHGTFDGLVNVVGGTRPSELQPALSYDLDAFDQVMQRNLRYTLSTSQAAARSMIRGGRGGSIVHVSSIMAVTAFPYGIAYATAKAGMTGLTRTMAAEWGRFGIRVNAVAPGAIRAPKHGPPTGGPLDGVQIALGREGRPAEIGSATAFLLSNLSSYISGELLVVDGGSTIVPPRVDEQGLPLMMAGSPAYDSFVSAWDDSVKQALAQ
jgi:NAD(P)-dependent dehydrogenase (short-subunit alcohol dehydrogenase family)